MGRSIRGVGMGACMQNQLIFMDGLETTEEGRAARRRPCLTFSEMEFNVALWKLIKGKGSLLGNLSVVASFGRNVDVSPDAIKGIVKRVEHEYSPEQIESTDELDPADRRYLEKLYGRSDDPAIREFLGSIHAPTRSRPDWRRSTDRVGSHGKASRVRVKKGAS